MKIYFEPPSGFSTNRLPTNANSGIPIPRVGEIVIVERSKSEKTLRTWEDLVVTKVVHDYFDDCIYIELKEKS